MRAALLALFAAGCGAPGPAPARAAITNGTPDSGDPAVVALLDANGVTECSGTLIAPHVVLTAAHCRIDSSNFDQFTVSFGQSASVQGALPLSDAQPHPAFDPTTFANDFALLTLRPVAPVSPLALDGRSFDASRVGQTFTAAGFGNTGAGLSDEGQKRVGTLKISAVGALDFTAQPSPSQPCNGDSGGAALFSDGGNTVLGGVVSHGDTACSDHAVFGRIDVAQAGFIQPFLGALGAAMATGARCYFDEQCTSGSCLIAADEPRRSFCSQPCKHDGDCPSGMSCAADGCRWKTPSPGALGYGCAADGDCDGAICWIEPGAKSGACTRTCDPSTQCPAGFECQNVKDITFYCIQPAHSGCAMGGGGGGSALLLALVLLALLIRRHPRLQLRA